VPQEERPEQRKGRPMAKIKITGKKDRSGREKHYKKIKKEPGRTRENDF
jgi:hypothetical protein